MPMSPSQIRRLIIEAFPDAHIELNDLRGDQDHYAAVVISEAFYDKSPIQQHQMVYAALGEHMGTTLHALSLKTQLPMEKKCP